MPDKKTLQLKRRIRSLVDNKFHVFYYSYIHSRYKKVIREVRKKEKIKVAFFLIHEPVWKYEGLYRLLESDTRFAPVVIVCPFIPYGEENMIRDMDQAFKAFSEKGYNVIRTFNKETGQWLDIKKEIKPDIVFFTIPHPVTREEYYINNYLDTLTCYVPYTFQNTYHYLQNYNRFFHNVLWRAYYQSEIHHKLACRYALNKGNNVVVTGYPGIDNFIDNSQSVMQKDRSRAKKNIIWAPHHTIEGEGLDLNFSCFLRYHEFMTGIAESYRDSIYITFKPHPGLRAKLSKKEIWGEEKTGKYYNYWKDNDFCALNDGNYQRLFLESDALIHDCDSFLAEYLSLNKPVLYTYRDPYVKDRLNEFGKSAYDMHYKAGDEKDIINFIDEIVINEKDEMKTLRTGWINDFIIPPGQGNASVNIFNDLKRSLES